MSYRMTLESLDFLVSQPGQALLRRLAGDEVAGKTSLALLSEFRKTQSQEHAAAALDLTLLRSRAQAKFSKAHLMYFTRESLEQASSEVVSAHRAERFATYSSVADLGCGIGGDSLQLARRTHVVAIDRDILRLRMAELNTRAYEVSDHVDFVCADIARTSIADTQAAFIDPSRRRFGDRVYSIHDYEPPLTILSQLVTCVSDMAAKVSPGVKYSELESLGLNYELEFVSENGTCKEGVLWLGDLRSECSRRATVLPEVSSITDRIQTTKVTVGPPRHYLYNPDSAVVRAHLVEQLASLEGLSKIDDQIAYLTSDRLVRTPFATALEIEESHPFNLKRLNERLRHLHVGIVTIMKRGSPIQPESFRKRLKLEGSSTKVLVFTRVQGQPHMLICSDGRLDRRS